MDKLFKIKCYGHKNDNIIVDIYHNLYVHDVITIPEYHFEKYLNRHERLYHEYNTMEAGELVCSTIRMTMDDYFESTTKSAIHEDLYDYICINYLDSSEATKQSLETIMKASKLI